MGLTPGVWHESVENQDRKLLGITFGWVAIK